MLVLAALFHLLSAAPLLVNAPPLELWLSLVLYPLAEWLFLFCLRHIGKQRRLELELLGCWLSGIGLVISGSILPGYAWRQAAAIVCGMFLYAATLWVVADVNRAMKLRPIVAGAAIALLALNLALAGFTNGQRNWISIGGFSFQPSELVKLAFIFVGGATLDRLQRTQSILRYLIFALCCVGVLFTIRDFGTALIFFATFLLIVFLRSGDLRTIALVVAAAAMGAALVLIFRSSVADRFRVYRHVWENMNAAGYQQTRVLIYSSSGGLLGLGLGNGKLRNVFAASTDLVFGMLCEEWGLLLAFLVPLCYLAIAIFTLRAARRARSSFHSIIAVSAAGLLLFQASLNIFGITDLLPLTGVTLPFVSRGGTSLLAAWGLLAFMRSAFAGAGTLRDKKPKTH
jgi:cell division protein FtsW (lipid II flippase)